MPKFNWTVNETNLQRDRMAKTMEMQFIKGTKIWSTYFRNKRIERQKYYEGFNVGRERAMYKEELRDLEIVYKTALKNYQKEVEDILPSLLYYMEKFLTVHKQNEAIREKFEVLLQKTGRESQDEDGDADFDGDCDE